jgi:hypothetical protein
MTPSDDVTDTVLTGDAYTRAAVSTRRFYPLGLRGKILLCLLTTMSAISIAPATYARRGLIASLEGETVVAGAIEPGFSAISLAGTVATATCALVLLRLLWVAETQPLTFERAVDMIRIEDAIMTVALSTGIIVTVAGVLLASIGLLAPESIVALYASGVEVYVHGSGLLAVDTRVTSGISGALSLKLTLLYLLITGERPRARVRRSVS